MDAEGAPTAGRAKRPARGGQKQREAERWDDPGSGSEGDEREEACHPQTDQGLKEGDDDESDDLKGSDSDGAADVAEELRGQAPRKRAAPEGGPNGAADAGGGDGAGLWDPLAGLGPRRKRRAAPAPGAGAPAAAPGAAPSAAAAPAAGSAGGAAPSWTSTFGFPEGSAVCLVGLTKAPKLNGTVGTVGAGLDRATGRCQIILRDGTVKSLKQENLREVLTGAVVRIHGLQGAAELNGRIAECGDLDLSSGRYMVSLADGRETQKRIKEANLELVRRYVAPVQLLSAQRRSFSWAEQLRRGADGGAQRPWADQLKHLTELGLPAPRLVPGAALARLGEGLGGAADLGEPVSADKVPVDADGRPMGRVLAVSVERDVCIPRDPPRAEDLRRLAAAAKALLEHDPSTPAYFLLPQLCVKPLPCLRAAAACGWPLYLRLCQALVCLDSPHRPFKGWCRTEAMVAATALSKPVYILSREGAVAVGGGQSAGAGGWLLSDRAESAAVGAPSDGQVLPAERALMEKMAAEVLPSGATKGAAVTMYRL